MAKCTYIVLRAMTVSEVANVISNGRTVAAGKTEMKVPREMHRSTTGVYVHKYKSVTKK